MSAKLPSAEPSKGTPFKLIHHPASRPTSLELHRYTCPMQPASIVVTELNEAREIERAISTLLAQVPPAAEVIVVDGGSTEIGRASCRERV